MFIKPISAIVIVIISSICLPSCTEAFLKEKPTSISYPDVRGLIAAFGDFDSDKLTDVFVIKQNLKAFQVMKHYDHGQLLQRSKMCRPFRERNQDLVGLIPGDFHGNAMMDVVLVSRYYEASYYSLRLLRGNTTNFECSQVNAPPFAEVNTQPLMLDFNGDMISDLMADDRNGQRSVWLGSANGTFEKIDFYSPTENVSMVEFPSNSIAYSNFSDTIFKQPITDPNANAFIDLNQDGVADIFVDGKEFMEYWYADDEREYGRLPPRLITRPSGYDIIGQSAFFDVSGDDQIEHLLPVCTKEKCSILALVWYEANSTGLLYDWVTVGDNFKFVDNSTFMKFTPVHYKKNLTLPITLRHGDLNGDGYEDIVTIMTAPSGGDRVVLLENVPSSDNVVKRAFQMFAKQPNIVQPIVATFFDIKEDSKLDILASTRPGIVNASQGPAIEARLNTQMFDANFIKILVASGRCPEDQCYKEGWVEQQYRVNYGTNQPGPFIR